MLNEKKTVVWPWLVGIVLVVGLGWWLFRSAMPPHTAPPPPASLAQVKALIQSSPQKGAAPVTPVAEPRHPIESPIAADAAIPALADSDAAAWEALSGLAGNSNALDVLLRDHVIERVVTMIDNLPRHSASRQSLALRPLPGDLQVQVGEGGTTLAPANAARYTLYVKVFTSADPQTLTRIYRRFYPLFQQAYAEVGYPGGYFNDRLVQVIDHLLQAPEPTQPLQVQSDGRGHYRFVDSELEALSIGQKALLRLGPHQEAAVKRQLRAICTALVQP